MMDKTLDESAFSHFKEIPCDKCGSVCSYANIDEVTECFGCKCKRLEEEKITCECGWVGNYFQYEQKELGHPTCPNCGKEGKNECP